MNSNKTVAALEEKLAGTNLYWVPGYVWASYEAQENPLTMLRKIFPDWEWQFWGKQPWMREDEGKQGGWACVGYYGNAECKYFVFYRPKQD